MPGHYLRHGFAGEEVPEVFVAGEHALEAFQVIGAVGSLTDVTGGSRLSWGAVTTVPPPRVIEKSTPTQDSEHILACRLKPQRNNPTDAWDPAPFHHRQSLRGKTPEVVDAVCSPLRDRRFVPASSTWRAMCSCVT